MASLVKACVRWNFIDISVVNFSQISQTDFYRNIYHWVTSYNFRKKCVSVQVQASAMNYETKTTKVCESGLFCFDTGNDSDHELKTFLRSIRNVVISQHCFCTVFILSPLHTDISMHILHTVLCTLQRGWQGEFVSQSGAALVGDHCGLYPHDFLVWFTLKHPILHTNLKN